MQKKYWDDLDENEQIHCQPVVMSREEIVEFARRYDPQEFHLDEHAASTRRFGGIIASSLQTLSACTRVLVDAQGELAIISGLGIEQVHLPNPVRPSDRLEVKAHWTGLRRSQTKPDRGLATLSFQAINQKGEIVLQTGYKYLIACRAGDGSD